MRRLTTLLSKLDGSPAGDELALSIDDVKLQRRVTTSSLDTLFTTWIQAATSLFEEYTGRQVTTALWEYTMDGFPTRGVIELPKPPLQTVISVTYLDDADVEQTVGSADYDVITSGGPHGRCGRVELKTGISWPSTSNTRTQGVRVLFRAGYSDDASGVPSLVKTILFFLVGHFHKYGEEVIGGPEANSLQKLPLGAETMMRAFKYSALPSVEPWQD